MILCPKCGKIADYSYYFGAYICSYCYWKDDTPNRERSAKSHGLFDDGSSSKHHTGQKELVNSDFQLLR